MNTKLAQTEPELVKKELRYVSPESCCIRHPSRPRMGSAISDLALMISLTFSRPPASISGRYSRLDRPDLATLHIRAFSAFAGQPLIISPDLLIKMDLLTKEDIASCEMPQWDPRKVDYGPAIEFKTKLLKKGMGCVFPIHRIRHCSKNLTCSVRRSATGLKTILSLWHAKIITKVAAGLNGKKKF